MIPRFGVKNSTFIIRLFSASLFHHRSTALLSAPIPSKPSLEPLAAAGSAGVALWFSQKRHAWKGASDYDYIRADVNCPRCSKQMPVIFSNRPLSITGRETGVYQALNLCPNCKTAFYFRPFKLVPLHGTFIEIGRVKGARDLDNDAESDSYKPTKGDFGTGSADNGGDANLGSVESDSVPKGEADLGRQLLTPKEISEALDKFIIGQEKAKKVRYG